MRFCFRSRTPLKNWSYNSLWPKCKINFNFHKSFDGELFNLGDVTIELLHTPGHTMESSFYCMMKIIISCVFTGDTLFVGDVGRPDLAVNQITLHKKIWQDFYMTH